MKSFKSKITEEKFNRWFNLFPESCHPNDVERFHDFLVSLFNDNDNFTEAELKLAISELKEWKNEEFIEEFVEIVITKIDTLKGFFDYLNENKY